VIARLLAGTRNGTNGAVTGSQVVVVRPYDTLEAICRRHLGRYDSTVLERVKALNPELSSFNNLQPGQRLRLPVNDERQ
jgi:phage tail protein X